MQEKGEFFRNLSEIIRIYRKLAEAARCRGHTPLNNKTYGAQNKKYIFDFAKAL